MLCAEILKERNSKMLQMMLYMAEVVQLIGAIFLIAIGVGIILYTLLRKTPSIPREDEPFEAEEETAETENSDGEESSVPKQDE